MEVEFNGLGASGVLQQAAFKGICTDKPPRSIVWDQAGLPAPATLQAA